MYTLMVDDLGALNSQAYYEVDRRLNLEQGRTLGKEEEAVNYESDEAMVFDIVDAKFAVLGEVESGGGKSISSCTYNRTLSLGL